LHKSSSHSDAECVKQNAGQGTKQTEQQKSLYKKIDQGAQQTQSKTRVFHPRREMNATTTDDQDKEIATCSAYAVESPSSLEEDVDSDDEQDEDC
jgi:hypothetical protein